MGNKGPEEAGHGQEEKAVSVEFIDRVAHGSLSGEHALMELPSRYGEHSHPFAKRKKLAKERVVKSFSGNRSHKRDKKSQIKELHTKIGQIAVEMDFKPLPASRLRTKATRDGLPSPERSVDLAMGFSWPIGRIGTR